MAGMHPEAAIAGHLNKPDYVHDEDLSNGHAIEKATTNDIAKTT